MIHYQLRCGDGHAFEGWFKDSAAFDLQAGTGLLSCPACGTTEVGRGLMAPAVRTRRARAPAGTTDGPAPTPQVADGGAAGAQASPPAEPGTRVAEQNSVPLPDELRAVLQKVRAHVERNCDDVGDQFAAEALRMHRGKAAIRGIYGNASETDRETLADEGVDIMQIPWLKPAES